MLTFAVFQWKTALANQTMNSCRSSFRSLVFLTITVLLLQARCSEEKTAVNQTNNCHVPKTSHCVVTLTNHSSPHHDLVLCKITNVCQLESPFSSCCIRTFEQPRVFLLISQGFVAQSVGSASRKVFVSLYRPCCTVSL